MDTMSIWLITLLEEPPHLAAGVKYNFDNILDNAIYKADLHTNGPINVNPEARGGRCGGRGCAAKVCRIFGSNSPGLVKKRRLKV